MCILIRTSWLSFADEEGSGSSLCQELAKGFKESVKYKHGYAEGTLNLPVPKSYPHWMLIKPSRVSTSAIGKMFDEAERTNDTTYKPFETCPEIDPLLAAPSVQFQQQHPTVAKIMEESISQLFSEYYQRVTEHVNSVDKQEFADLMNDEDYIVLVIFDDVRLAWRKRCQELAQTYNEQTNTKEEDKCQMAFASFGYVHAYTTAIGIWKAEISSKRKTDILVHLSFPWIVNNLLFQL